MCHTDVAIDIETIALKAESQVDPIKPDEIGNLSEGNWQIDLTPGANGNYF